MAEAKKDAQEVLELLSLIACNSESSDSDEGELEWLYLELAFAPKKAKGPRLSVSNCSEEDFLLLFRFTKLDFQRLLVALQLPDEYRCVQNTKSSGKEALLVLLRRLAYPNRWCDLVPLFGRSETEMSIISRAVLEDIYGRFSHLLEDLQLVWLDAARFATAVQEAGAPLDNCWGFIDGTARPIARPVRNQQVMYSGHKRIHCLKFQSVVAANGLIAHMYGPIAGRHHDAFMLRVSGLQQQLATITTRNGPPFVIYGDPAYGVSQTILAPYRGSQLSPQQQLFNSSMSRVRVSVEWTFGKILSNFSYLDSREVTKYSYSQLGSTT